MARKLTEKNTKAELLEGYSQLQEEKKGLETQIKQLQKEQKDKPSVAPDKQSLPQGTAMNQPQTVKDKMSYTIDSLVKLQLGFGSAVSDLSEKLTSEAAKLEELRQSVTEETQQLKDLHALEEIQDDTLDTLIQTYEDNSKAFEEEIGQRREALEQEIQELRQGWEKEQEEYKRSIKERNEQQSKVRQRDVQEYEYDLALRRGLDNDQYEQTQKRLYKELEDTKQAQEKQWDEREKAIAEREKKFEELKAKVEAFEKDKEAAIKKAKAEGEGIARKQVSVQEDLQSKDLEGQKRNYELRIQSLEQTIQNQEARIHNLSKQLDGALKQVQDLAVKAIEGASNINSYQALKEIAMEQAKAQTKNK
jgi:DNA repair exonuclease SbcCD ATPase subunit